MAQHRYRSWALVFLLGTAIPLLAACSSDGPTGPTGSSTISLELQGLQRLGDGLSYQAWAVARQGQGYYGYPLLIFDVDEEGAMVDPVTGEALDGPFPAALDPEDVVGVAISLELGEDLVPYSSYTFLMGGLTEDGVVEMTPEDWLGMNTDLSQISGSYVLGALTNDAPDYPLSGLWFLTPSGVSHSPSLLMPTAPDGWDYEGWVEVDGRMLSTGKFYLADMADISNYFSDGAAGPDFPGEDFLTNAPVGVTLPTDLSDARVFITLEPWEAWDVSPTTPFYLTILEGQVPADAVPLTSYLLTSLSDQLPRGTATVQ